MRPLHSIDARKVLNDALYDLNWCHAGPYSCITYFSDAVAQHTAWSAYGATHRWPALL